MLSFAGLSPNYTESSIGYSELPASPHRPTRRAEITPILPNHRMVAAFAAQAALHEAGFVVVAGGFEDAHFADRVTLFVQHAEAGIAVDDEGGHVGHGGGPVLLALLAGHPGHEVAEGLGVVQELAQLHADPGRVH